MSKTIDETRRASKTPPAPRYYARTEYEFQFEKHKGKVQQCARMVTNAGEKLHAGGGLDSVLRDQACMASYNFVAAVEAIIRVIGRSPATKP